MKASISTIAAILALAAVQPVWGQAAPAVGQAMVGAVETAATRGSGADGAVVLADPADAARSLIFTGAGSAGIDVFAADGKRVATHAIGNVVSLDARADAAPGGGSLIAALDRATNGPSLLRLELGGAIAPIALAGIKTSMNAVGLCLSRSYRDNTLYLFLLGDEGGIEQYSLSASASGGMTGRIARRWSLGSEVGYCAGDDRGSVYVSQEIVGVWRFGAEPEAEIVPEIVDIVRLGQLSEEAKGVAVAPDGRLVVSDASANRLNIYDPADDYAYKGSVQLAAGSDALEEPGSITVSAGPGASGLIVVADDDNSPGLPNFKIARWSALLAAAGLPEVAAPASPPKMPLALASVETAPMETGGDAADDPAIWIDPTNPGRSVVIGTQKQSGLYVYGLDGKVLQFLPDGRMNNVDLRNDFNLRGRKVTLVAASNRTTKGISIYTLDPATRVLTSVADGIQPTGFDDPYGLCMYRSGKSKKTFVFVNQGDGQMKQWEFIATSSGKVRSKLVRSMKFGTQVEGCVADDETGMLYTGEEDVGVWREGAEPRGGPARTSLITVADNPALKDDMEGIGIYKLDARRGYLVVSSQGNDSYAVFRREGDNAYVGSFRVGADPVAGIDGISETDGLEVTSMSAGPGFAGGMMVAQDGRNVSPPEHQNFKLVPWDRIAKALGLDTR